jgi:hypothetical protein
VIAIPDMGAHSIGGELELWASESLGAIVEVGSWLGAGTAYLARGARISGAEVHVYDRWRASPSEARKAEAQGVDLRAYQDTLPMVRSVIDPIGADVRFHRGDIRNASWSGDPIGLYVDDAAKRPGAFRHMRDTFWPHLVDGAVVVMMDFFYFLKTRDQDHRCQFEFIGSRPDSFAPIMCVQGKSIAAFRYRRIA